MKLIIPKEYRSVLSLRETEVAIKKVKDYFERRLSEKLCLTRISAPLFVDASSGLNDNLNGTERPVSFDLLGIKGVTAEIVHSLAKWKRNALSEYGFSSGEGLYADMNAIRRDEETDNIHSVFVDQWDWEKIIEKTERNKDTLHKIVSDIYSVLKETENYICAEYPQITPTLPDEIFFITSQELLSMYPSMTAKEREYAITKEKKAVFIEEIGANLSNGAPHDGRAPDYDDWELNGDILVYFELLDIALELSSMGIRVSEESLYSQLSSKGLLERLSLPFQKALYDGKLPYTVGGGIGQSRMCMFFLKKAHIGEVQASMWPSEDIKLCRENGINIL